MVDEADILHSQGDLAAAAAAYGEAETLALTLKDGELLPRIQRARARLYRTQGKLPESMALQELVLARRADVDGDAHPDTLDSRNELAEICEQLGKYDCAARNRELLAQAYRQRPHTAREVQLDNLTRLSHAYRKLGRADEAAKAADQLSSLKTK